MTRTLPASALARAARVMMMAAALASVMPATAVAQLIPSRPFRAIFRTTANPAASRHAVNASAFLAGGHDESSLSIGGFELPLDSRLRRASFGSLFGTVVYAYRGPRSTFSADAGTTVRYYSAIAGLSPMNVFGGVRWSRAFGRQGSLGLSQRVVHSPYYTFDARPSAPADAGDATTPAFDPGTDLRATRRATSSYDTAVEIGYKVGRRSQLRFVSPLTYVDSSGPALSFLSYRPSVGLSTGFGRYATFNVGYGYFAAKYLDSPFDPLAAHDINVGVGYSRPLAFSRRTRVGFSTGSAVAVHETGRTFHVTGSAFLARQITRTWGGSASYRRGVDVLAGFARPFFISTDAVSASVGGRLAGPVTLSGAASYSRGTFSLGRIDNSFGAMSASARVQVPVVQMLGVYAEGHYTDYSFEQRLGLLPDVPIATTRYGIRVGLNLWVPILR